ncbi:MAG: DinB family protein [Candidatus Electryonea clarkiae]|nr:DinB family protein [Candidatus Electryonea clarkiae]MDP8289316.1 DinB family protein [Candidatus Electryonea clarkiae]
MGKNPYVDSLRSMQKFFNKTIEVLDENDSSFRATDDTRTVAEQIAHTAQTIDWFFEFGFLNKGLETDFEKMEKAVQDIKSFVKAKEWFDRSVDSFCKHLETLSEEDVMELLPDNDFFGRVPKILMLHSAVEHTAHHRGSLAVYVRLIGKTPLMPYME